MNPNKITTTVGLNIGKIDIAGIRLNFWDLGGQEELQSLWDKVSQVNFFFLLRASCNMLFCKTSNKPATEFQKHGIKVTKFDE
jgi:uncharacterized membrane protein